MAVNVWSAAAAIEANKACTQGAQMADDIGARLRRIQGLAGKIEEAHEQVAEMMRLRVADGLSAMSYGQYGGSFPDPTPGAVFDIHGDLYDADGKPVPVRWRDARPEQDIIDYEAGIATAEKKLTLAAENALVYVDFLRRKYTSANLEIRNRLDPSDFCHIHFALHLYEGHRRTKGNLCKTCAGFYDDNKREPTPTEADYFHRHGRWPHKLFDPKERRAV